MTIRFVRTALFWLWTIPSLLIFGIFFAWELGFLRFLPSLPRMPATKGEIAFSMLLAVLLSLNIGLLHWRNKYSSCPVGTKRASGLGSAVGVITLLCPVCLLLPVSLFGLSISLTLLVPYLPLLRLVALLLLGVSTWMLWPKDTQK